MSVLRLHNRKTAEQFATGKFILIFIKFNISVIGAQQTYAVSASGYLAGISNSTVPCQQSCLKKKEKSKSIKPSPSRAHLRMFWLLLATVAVPADPKAAAATLIAQMTLDEKVSYS